MVPSSAVVAAGVLRVAAAALGLVALYLACFLYSDEEGKLQSRVEELWIGVHDRAKVTKSTTTALLNTVGATLTSLIDKLYGARLLSVVAVFTSFNLSVGLAILLCIPFLMLAESFERYKYPSIQWATVFYQYFGTVEGLIINRPSTRYLIGAAAVAIALLAIGLSKIWFRPTWWFTVLSGLPLLISSLIVGLQHWHGLHLTPYVGLLPDALGAKYPLIVFVSVAGDYLVLVVIRKSSRVMATSFSAIKVIVIMTSYLISAVVVIIIPRYLIDAVIPFHNNLLDVERRAGGEAASILNVSTAVELLIPFVVLTVVLVHRIAWPALSRCIYVMARYKLLTERKVLVPLGTLCITFAFGLEHVGLKELLKLLS